MKVFFSAVFIAVLSAFVYIIYIYANVEYRQLDVASAILCENAAKYGRADIIEKLEPYVKNEYAIESIANSLYYAKNGETDLKRLIANRPSVGRISVKDRALSNEIIRRYCHFDGNTLHVKSFELKYAAMFFANTPVKAKIFYILGVALKDKTYISMANEIVESIPVWGIEYTDILLDIAEIAINSGNVEDFFKYMDMAPYSLRRAGMYYLVCKDPETLNLAWNLFKKGEMSSISRWNMVAVLRSEKHITKNIQTVFDVMDDTTIFAYQGIPVGKIRKNNAYKYPSIVLLSHILSESSVEKDFTNKVLSVDTYNKVKARYLGYTQFANVVFCITNNRHNGLVLLDRVNNPLQKTRLFKRLARILTENKDFLDVMTDCILMQYNGSFHRDLFLY
ncbi:MAG: hypothetical protein SPF41_05675 [Candidatus Merdousia sp.]|nr:hypothetical protein [Candidatus Merdousia sp.]